MNDSKPTSNRWYDKRPSLSLSINLLAKCPFELQTLVGEGMSQLAQKQFKAQDLLQSVKSLGVDKTLGLYKAKKKQRSYDSNPAFHHAMNCLYVLAAEHQDFMANQILELMDMVHDYFRACRLYGAQSSQSDVANLTRTFVENGSPAARTLLVQLKRHLMQNIEAHLEDATKISDNPQGMRIVDKDDEPRP